MRKVFFPLPVLLLAFSLGLQQVKSIVPPTASPIDGKMYFSNAPFGTSNANSKTNFSSAEYVYARVEIPSGTIKEAFKIKENEKTLPYLRTHITISQNGELIHYGSTRDFILVRDEFKNTNVLHFDVLPEAAKASTLYSMLEDFSAGNGMNPLTSLIRNGRLPAGKYKIGVKLYTETYNAYGSLQDQEKWPSLEGEYDLTFNEDDVERILANDDKITSVVMENAFRLDKLPPVFSNPGKLTDPNASAAKISAILKRDLPGRQILKWVAESYAGNVWHIAHDDYGLPKYKYFNPHIWMAYKANGKCYVGYVTLRQVYSGGGTFGPLAVAYTTTKDDKGIDCVKVK